MGLIQAFAGALGGTLAAQWKDFLTVPANLPPTAAFFQAVDQGTNEGRGSNTKGPKNIVTNGSKILVPEGYGLLTIEQGKITAVALEAGGYEWQSNDPNSATIFAGQWGATMSAIWKQFTFGGQPGSQQLAFFVSLKELPNNLFGTQSEIYFDDKYMNAQVGVITRGSYTMRILDPVIFVAKFLPATYFTADAPVFDFTDQSNPVGNQLFNEVVGSLAPAFSLYSNDPEKGRISKIQADSIGFALSLADAVEKNYSWKEDRGLGIEKVSLVSIEYDENTRELLKTVQRADALLGSRGNSNLQASLAAGFEAAGEGEGGAGGIMGLGIAGGVLPGGIAGVGGLQQPADPTPAPAAPEADDLKSKLEQLKGLLDQGLITQENYDAAVNKALGL